MANSTRAPSHAPQDLRASAPDTNRRGPPPATYTERALAEARRRYEQTDESLTSIAVAIGTSERSLQRIARAEAWVRYVPPPRDIQPAARLLMQTQALEEGDDGDGEGAEPDAAPPDDPAATLDRLLRAVLRELAAVEAMRAAMKATPQRPRDAVATAQTLASLTETLNKLQRMRCGLAEQSHDDSDDMPADIDAFREALARRIDAFVASRTDAGAAGRDDAHTTEEA